MEAKSAQMLMAAEREDGQPLGLGLILRTWWPLAASWLLMALELPALSAVVARLPDPQTNLAAWGGVVFPFALLVESPIIMLLAASTALSRDWPSYRTLRRYMMIAGGALTSLHVLLAFTPLFDLVVVQIIAVPAQIVEPARLGLRLMTPWTWSIAYRRFQQGVLIRFGHSRAVGMGTVIRLTADITVLLMAYALRLPGIVAAGLAVSSGVMSEALYAGIRVRPVLREQLRQVVPAGPPISLRAFLDFYVPLAMTSLLTLLVQPIGSAAISRMPRPLESLAVWPVLAGLVFMMRALGVAYNEVVVALAERNGALKPLWRFALALGGSSTLLLLLMVGTPLAGLWMEGVSALDATLAELARQALWFALPMPFLSALQSYYQGVILAGRKTRGVTEAVALFLVVATLLLAFGVWWGRLEGASMGWLAFSVGAAAQTLWLYARSRRALARLRAGLQVAGNSS